MTEPTPRRCVLYLRSSKDRSDASIEAQRHELVKLAAERGITIVGEYADVVESGKDADRAGFQRLYEDLCARGRSWDLVLALDTSRIARRRHIALHFEEREARPRGVTVLYKSLAGVDPESEILIKSVFQGVDEWHSRISKRKAKAGMSVNVRRGFRAGGRAPIGYRLVHIDTGAVREGKPVLKSRLELDATMAPAVAQYLKARAAGIRRTLALETAGLAIAKSSLVGLEWNALTYAGQTVWNRHGEQGSGMKRRDRTEWEIQRDTHPALITEEEAEKLLANLVEYSHKRPRRTSAAYLLTGLLKTADGEPWYGAQGGRYYRAGSRYVSAKDVDQTVLENVRATLRNRGVAHRMTERVHTSARREHATEIGELKAAAAAIGTRISRFMDMAEKLETAGPVLRKVDELERERRRLDKAIDALHKEASAARAAQAITEDQVHDLLDGLADGMPSTDREALKEFLATILRRVTINADTLSLRLHYTIRVPSRNKLASPRENDPIATAELTTCVRIKHAA